MGCVCVYVCVCIIWHVRDAFEPAGAIPQHGVPAFWGQASWSFHKVFCRICILLRPFRRPSCCFPSHCLLPSHTHLSILDKAIKMWASCYITLLYASELLCSQIYWTKIKLRTSTHGKTLVREQKGNQQSGRKYLQCIYWPKYFYLKFISNKEKEYRVIGKGRA